MNRSISLANRLREVLLNGKWIANTNLQEQISNTNWQQATKQVGNLNTIALLVFHLNYYLSGLINVFDGGQLEIKDKYSFDMPEIKTQNDWQNLVDDFLRDAKTFANHVEKMDDSLFEQPFTDEKYGSYQRNIEGVIEHSYYHLGQVSLIKKLIEQQ